MTVDIYHNPAVSVGDVESLFSPIFSHVYSYSHLLAMCDHVWCAYIDRNLIGCVLAKQSSTSSSLYLLLFGIQRMYQSLGVGSRLLSTIINYTAASFYSRIYLHTECINQRAIRFYRRFHFQIDRSVENYYESMPTFHPHAYRMTRQLRSVRK